MAVLDVKWDPKIYYYTAATVVVLADNVTNVTHTSIIQGSPFVLPSYTGGIAHPVDGSVLSTEFAGTEYSL